MEVDSTQSTLRDLCRHNNAGRCTYNWKGYNHVYPKCTLNTCLAKNNEDGVEPCDTALPGKGLWETAGGSVLEIKDMATNHIKNAIRYFKGNDRYACKIEELKKELKSRKNSIKLRKKERLYTIQCEILLDAVDEEDARRKAESILKGEEDNIDANYLIHVVDMVDYGDGIETLKKLRKSKEDESEETL